MASTFPRKFLAPGILFPFAAMLIIAGIRSDSFFPFSKTVRISLLMLYVLLHTILFLIAYSIWSKNCKTGIPPEADSDQFSKAFSQWIMPLFIWPSLLLIIAIHYFQFRNFQPIGYSWDWMLWGACALISICLVCIAHEKLIFGKWGLFPSYLTILLAFFILKIPPIFDFPLTPFQSDTLLNLTAAGKDLLKTSSPYQFHKIGLVNVANDHFPAMIMAYLPSALFQIDPRWIKLFFELASAIGVTFILLRLNPKYQFLGITLSLLFWTNPYLAYRHEISGAPLWFALLLVLASLKKERQIINALCVGVLISLHPWGWISLPLIVMFQIRALSTQALIAWASISAVVALALLGPFAIGDSSHFFQQLRYSYSLGTDGLHLPQAWERMANTLPLQMSIYPWLQLTDSGLKYGFLLLLGILLGIYSFSIWKMKKNISLPLWAISLSWLAAALLSPTTITHHYFTILFFILVFQLLVWDEYFQSNTENG